jgi:glycosyltransferase involved in cell wall biosynthesis/predicted ATP-grasp superfamily ATP-dependent carboligase
VDPIESFGLSRPAGHDPAEVGRLHLGFAAFWEPVPQRTLSGVAWNLREQLRSVADVKDIGVEFSPASRTAFKAAHTRYRGGRFTTTWSYSKITDAYVAGALRRGAKVAAASHPLDAVLMVDTLTRVREPYFVYYDSSWDGLIAAFEAPEHYAAMRRLRPAHMMRRRDYQVAVYQGAAGIIAESHWLARCLTELSGVPAEKIHVVHPAAVIKAGTAPAAIANAGPPRRNLLCVSRMRTPTGFYRKGIDLLVDAVGVLRREYDPQITLTVAGMEKWLLPGDPPDGVNLVGVVSPAEVTKLYETHDVFVMPSRMEPFGLVFAEALARGMPVVARNAYAMPEIVTPGVSGALIEKDDPDELAAAIAGVLADDHIYRQCADRAPAIAEYFSWERAAREVVDVIATAIRLLFWLRRRWNAVSGIRGRSPGNEHAPRSFDALVLDASYKQSLASVRSLGRAGLRVAVGETVTECRPGNPVPAFYSRYSARRVVLPSHLTDEDAFAAAVVDFVREFPTRVVLPTGDATIASVARARDQLAALGCTLALAPDSALAIASDKDLTLKIADELGIAMPTTIGIGSVADLPAAIAALGFPFVLKPTISWTGKSADRLTPIDVLTEAEAAEVTESFLAAGSGVLAQQFASGRREGVTLVVVGGEVLASCGHIAHRTTPPLGGNSVIRESIQATPDLLDASVRLAKAIGLEGPCEVEFRRDAEGRPLLMEINPRLAGTLENALRSGVDVPLMTWRWAAGEQVRPVHGHRLGVRTRSLAGDLAWLSQNQRRVGRPDSVPVRESLWIFGSEFFRSRYYDIFDLRDVRPGGAELRRIGLWAREFIGKNYLSRGKRSKGATNVDE